MDHFLMGKKGVWGSTPERLLGLYSFRVEERTVLVIAFKAADCVLLANHSKHTVIARCRGYFWKVNRKNQQFKIGRFMIAENCDVSFQKRVPFLSSFSERV